MFSVNVFLRLPGSPPATFTFAPYACSFPSSAWSLSSPHCNLAAAPRARAHLSRPSCGCIAGGGRRILRCADTRGKRPRDWGSGHRQQTVISSQTRGRYRAGAATRCAPYARAAEAVRAGSRREARTRARPHHLCPHPVTPPMACSRHSKSREGPGQSHRRTARFVTICG